MTDSHSTTPKKVLVIGGHGKVGQLTTSRLIAAGMDVTSLIRNPDQAPDIEALGATPFIRDLTALGVEDWAAQLRDYDVTIWTAGNAGKDGASATYAIDRDGALACIDALEQLRAEGLTPPRLLMVSYLGSLDHGVDPEDSFYPCADSKEAVDRRLLGSDLEFLILAPARLTLEPAGGLEVVDNVRPQDGQLTTSRELVAKVLVEMATRETLPERQILPFVDADGGGNAGEAAISRL
ncbi:nucleoside-diphosphate-sugar epimerase [Corynebacterium humireducens NBRC 106098 = DSM 45392]|uniref:Nucleoside-diphosphate-sugar epimerase n=1 Tax=Corynebacterium humireducens NBRC 106098 = DSM 45392 TaxID=1223515 RepID=A0A0B5D7V7_9CORY|nr:NAD(P)H-binding protein [Corynebacterium humireducens]AJE33182.1 nucleoside-diphosphate-sugar epimerase [Corynebacterium humireducens NBRC 106098 = DSM 45392]